MGLPRSTRQRTLSWELLGLVPLFSLAGSHRSCSFTWLQPPRASLPILSDISCPPLRYTAWQEKLEWTTPGFFVILQHMGESVSSYQNLKAAARAVYKDCSLKTKFPFPPSKHKLNWSLGEVFKVGHVFSLISFQHQLILNPLGTKLWGPFIANSNCRLHEKSVSP